MNIRIKSITFDFTTDYPEFAISTDEQSQLVENITGSIFTVTSEDEVADTISDYTDWLVESVDYEVI